MERYASPNMPITPIASTPQRPPLFPPGMPGAAALLTIHLANGEQRVTSLGPDPVTVGRADGNTVVIKDEWVSRQHLDIAPGPDGRYYVRDLGSRNGVFVNGQRVQTAPLASNDTIQLGQNTLTFSAGVTSAPPPVATDTFAGETAFPADGTRIANSNGSAGASANGIGNAGGDDDDTGGLSGNLLLYGRADASIGRAADSDLVLDHIQISRRHARVRWDGRQYLISDLGSTNGTYVNGERIQEAALTENARVQIGPFHFSFTQGALRQQHDTIRVDAVQVNQEVAGGTLLLKNVSFSILPKEFVCIVGGSGAGKSTLLDAISGVRPASHGTILYNGVDYYGSLDEFRSLIGYVPQDDIVPTQLTVRQALSFAGQLRLPPDARPEDIKARVDDALDLMELTARADVDIHRLSGGQRKRVSIGVELLTDPTLFFLDEPTSGLDPGLETRMMQLMRKVADRGKTVILVTHATQNVTLCDKVIFMAPGGYLAYFGPPKEALEFFGVETFADIYVLLGQPNAPEEWAHKYAASVYQERYVDDRITRVIRAQERQQHTLPPPAIQPDQKLQRAQAISQFKTLTHRYIATILKDRQYLAIILAQAPIIGLLLSIVYNRRTFTVDIMRNAIGQVTPDLNAPKATTLTCLLVIVALWFGVSNSAREIVKEASIYRRERTVNLQLGPYLASKFSVLIAICLLQNFVMLGVVGLIVPYRIKEIVFNGITPISLTPLDGSWIKAFVTMTAVSVAGVATGLLLSSVVANADRAASIVPIVLIPQVIFSGTLVSYPDLPAAGKPLAWLMAGHWGVQAVGGASGTSTIWDAFTHVANASKRPGEALLVSPFWVGVWPSIIALATIALVSLVGTVWSLQRKDIKRQLAKMRRVPRPAVTGQFRTV